MLQEWLRKSPKSTDTRWSCRRNVTDLGTMTSVPTIASLPLYYVQCFCILYTCSKHCNLIGLSCSGCHYSDRDLHKLKQRSTTFYKIYKIVLISKKNSVYLLYKNLAFFTISPDFVGPHLSQQLLLFSGSLSQKSWVKVATKETLTIGHCYEVLKTLPFPQCILNNLEASFNGLYGIQRPSGPLVVPSLARDTTASRPLGL